MRDTSRRRRPRRACTFFMVLCLATTVVSDQKATFDLITTRMMERRGRNSHYMSTSPVVALINAQVSTTNLSYDHMADHITLRCKEKNLRVQAYNEATSTSLPNLPLSSLVSSSSRGIGMLTLQHLPKEITTHGDRVHEYKMSKGLVDDSIRPFSAVLVLGENSAFEDHTKSFQHYRQSLGSCEFVVQDANGDPQFSQYLEEADSANDREQVCRRWSGSIIPQIRKTVQLVQKSMGEKPFPRTLKPGDIGSAAPFRSRPTRIHDISESMMVNTADTTEMFSAHMCKAGHSKDIGSSIGEHMKTEMKTFLPSFMAGMFSGIAKVFTEGFLFPLLNAIVKGVTDAFVDMFTLGLVMAFAAIVESDVAPLGDSIEVEILFYCPPALTIMLSGAIIQKLCFSLTGFLVKIFANFFKDEVTPSISNKISHDMADDISNSLETTLLHELEVPLTHTLSYGLKDAVPHYYYCTHCYYYGDYCQYCFYHRDYNWLNRVWYQGRLKPAHDRTMEVPGDPEKEENVRGGQPAFVTPPTPEDSGEEEKAPQAKIQPSVSMAGNPMMGMASAI